MALPMPRSENDSNMIRYVSPNTGMNRDVTVIIRLIRTVFFRPILFMSMPVGTENIRNQKNTSEGKRFACASVRFKSFWT